MSDYFRINWDPDFPEAWWLGEVECEATPIDCRIFTGGRGATVDGPLKVPIKKDGTALDLAFAAFAVPIVSREVGDIFEKLAPEAVQRFPVRVGNIGDKYEVLNIVQTLDAVDRERSVYLMWGPEDGRPDKLGCFRDFDRLVLQRDLEPPPHVFRIRGWHVVLAVSRILMEALGGANLRGVKFYPLEQ